ncbi:hypothetical protein [Streptomyces sp. NPDC001604]|uniref:hypothetical protein n=1 Tax=Streptomyces sp. NPDC001604 TaxID=3364593 RepID=UPI0036A8AD8F
MHTRRGRAAGFNQAALLTTVPVGALGDVPVLVAAATIALASGGTLWVRMRRLPDQAQ